jgi:hypothetical protein
VDGHPYIFAFDVVDDRIRGVFMVVNPDKLRNFPGGSS